jgi:hypothetical protein
MNFNIYEGEKKGKRDLERRKEREKRDRQREHIL